jgi:hypothetical protein
MICLVLALGSAAAAEETEGENGTTTEEITGEGRTVLGGYTFERNQIVDSPNIFVSRNPATDAIVFEDKAVLDGDILFTLSNYQQWEKWLRETGADPARMAAYDLNPLSVFTVGNAYNNITLEKGARVINRATESDGMFILGPADINIKEDTLVHGGWAGLSLGNLTEPEPENYYEVSVVNRGLIGTFTDETGPRDEEGNRPVLKSRSGILIYEGVGGSVVNESTGTITGSHFGIRVGYSELQGDFIPRGDPDLVDIIKDSRFSIVNHGIIQGGVYEGIFDGGGYESVEIVNHETGVIEGGRSGIMLLGGGKIDNRGVIRGGENGIFISTGTMDITHSGELSVTGEEGGDAILFSAFTEGGTVALYSGVDGNIRHIGDSVDAVLYLFDTADGADASVGNIVFGDGAVTQYGGIWNYKDIAANSLRLENGAMRLSKKIEVDQGLFVGPDAVITVTDGVITAGNFINRGILNFYHGEIAVDGGVFDYADPRGARDFALIGGAEDQIPHLRIADGASTAGIRHIVIGGEQAGMLTVEGGRVTVPDGLEVMDKGWLSGAGLVQGSVLAAAGSTIKPGYGKIVIGSPDEGEPKGTLAIEGDLTIHAESTVNIGIDRGDDNNANIHATGFVGIEGGTVTVTDISGRTIQDGAVYTFLTADRFVAGEFDAITGSPIFTFDLDYGFDNVSFRVTRLIDYDDFTVTANQAVMAEAYQTAREDGHLPNLVIAMEDVLVEVLEERASPDLLRYSLDRLSPEPYQAAFRMTADMVGDMNRHFMRSARQTRLKLGLAEPGAEDDRAFIVPGETGTSTWAKPFRLFYGTIYRYSDVEPDPSRTGYYHKARGYYLGYERPVGTRINAGVGFQYLNNQAYFNRSGISAGHLETESFRFGPHATVAVGNLELDIVLSGGRHKNYQDRDIAESRYKIYDATAYADLRYSISPAGLFRLSPSAAIAYTYQRRERIREKNGGDANLEIPKDSFDTLRSTLGLSLSREIRRSASVIIPELTGAWRNEMAERDLDINASFIGAPESPEGGFTVTGKGPDRDFYVAGARITFLFGDFNVAHIGYEREFRDSGDVDAYFGGVKWNF